MQPRTIITSNGSKWNGQESDSIERLLEVLANVPLDRTFEKYGNFVTANPQHAVYLGEGEYKDTGPIFPGEEMTRFFGNFFGLSHVFNIDTSETETVKTLTAAIRANQQRADYLTQVVA
jgi:hypothetical protein